MSIFKLSDTIRRTETVDGGILLDVHHGQMFCMNVVGAKVLELLGRGYNEAYIADEISRYYGTDREIVRSDVTEFSKLCTSTISSSPFGSATSRERAKKEAHGITMGSRQHIQPSHYTAKRF